MAVGTVACGARAEADCVDDREGWSVLDHQDMGDFDVLPVHAASVACQ
jgi:hypothetical protein